MGKPPMTELAHQLKPLIEAEEFDYVMFDEIASSYTIKKITPDAALIYFRIKKEEFQEFFPKSQMRELDGDICVSKWILGRKDVPF